MVAKVDVKCRFQGEIVRVSYVWNISGGTTPPTQDAGSSAPVATNGLIIGNWGYCTLTSTCEKTPLITGDGAHLVSVSSNPTP